MRRIIIFILPILVMILTNCGKSDSQKKLENGIWQLQNPASLYENTIASFQNGQVNFDTKFMDGTDSTFHANGTYVFKNDTILVISMQDVTYTYTIKWFSGDQVELYNSTHKFILSRQGSGRDKYMANLRLKKEEDLKLSQVVLQDTIASEPSPNTGSSNYTNGCYVPIPSGNTYSNEPTNTQKVCYTCLGTGRCRVCGGSGVYSIYGQTQDPCSACGGDGKCWRCHGTGMEP